MADKLEEWDPKTGAVAKPKPTPIRAGGNPKIDAPSIQVSPGGYMKSSRTPNYNKGGMVKLGSPKVSAPCKDTKTLTCK